MKVIWISVLVLCLAFLYTDTQTIISARLGSTVLLLCNYSAMIGQKPHIHWGTDREVVFEHLDSGSFEGPSYRGRVDVPKDELLKGNCSLVLKDVRPTDEGVYRTYLWVTSRKRAEDWRLIRTVELKVEDTSTSIYNALQTRSPRNDVGRNSSHLFIVFSPIFIFTFQHLLRVNIS